jgi:hypothetical protein
VRFPNCERFWQQLVTPVTKRIERAPKAPDRIERREGIIRRFVANEEAPPPQMP